VEPAVCGSCSYRIARAGRLTRIDGRNVLRLAANPATEQLYAKVAQALAARLIFGLGAECRNLSVS
jgi:hypothetical protein